MLRALLLVAAARADECAHITFDDVAFMAERLTSDGVDATEEGWPDARRELLNHDRSRCGGAAVKGGGVKVFGVGLSKTGTSSPVPKSKRNVPF